MHSNLLMKMRMEFNLPVPRAKTMFIAFMAERNSVMSTVTMPKCIFMCLETRYCKWKPGQEAPYLT